jgi:heme oxygenase (biliverdin-IX-beta and delta-forming)
MEVTIAEPRHQRLSAATDELHEHLHTIVASLEPFASRERFGTFVAVQYLFQRAIEPLYEDSRLQGLIPDLAGRSRRAAVESDLTDLGVPRPSVVEDLGQQLSAHQALGWLFVSEGSTLGAAMLIKRVQPLGLSDSFGARHLAAHPDGRAKHWKRFTEALNSLQLTDDEEAEVIDGAKSAFRHFGVLLRQQGSGR